MVARIGVMKILLTFLVLFAATAPCASAERDSKAARASAREARELARERRQERAADKLKEEKERKTTRRESAHKPGPAAEEKPQSQ